MRILGIDPGYGRLGWAVVDVSGAQCQAVAFGCLETPKTGHHAERLATIAREVRSLMEQHAPQRLAVEKILFTKSHTTAIGVAEARGVVLAIAGALRLPVVEMNPMQVKQAATGNGHADKAQVQEMVRRLLGLTVAPQPDDAADACAVAIAGSGALVEEMK
jgi:crossover junction endodeoxyribonuclease RuvC